MKIENNIIDRLATVEELDEVYTFVAQSIFKDNKLIKEDIFNLNVNNLPDDEFLEELKNEAKNEIGEVIIVKNFTSFNVKFYTYNQLYHSKDGGITLAVFRIINRNGKLEYLTEEETEFNFDVENILRLIKKDIKKAGRPKQPTIESIHATLLVQNAIKNDNNNTIDFYCKMFCLPKTTYYRVSKWLDKNTQLINKTF